MVVRVKDRIRNRHPESNDGMIGDVSLYDQVGYVVHKLPDDYWLIEFPQFSRRIKGEVKELTWYIHRCDLIEIVEAK